jgi:CRISPR/Cas system-associated endonuclease Cas3-HD
MLVYHAIKAKEYKMIAAGFLHDIGKPLVAYQGENDKLTGQYSFTHHEEISYQLIRKVPFISDYTKKLVRYHFLIRGMEISKRKGYEGRYRRMKRIYDGLEPDFIEDLNIFIEFDDKAKV